jgi:hypothetical protein
MPEIRSSYAIPRGRRVLAFARRRVTAFSVVALTVAGVALAPTACSSPVNGSMTSFDAAPPPLPGPCVVTKTAVAACEAGPAILPDAGDLDAGAGDGEAPDAEPSDASADGGPPDATGPVVPPASENRCLVTADIAVACPSVVASVAVTAGKEGASDVLVSQRGLAYYADPAVAAISNDDRAHLQIVHLDAAGRGSVTMNPIDPYVATAPITGGAGLLSGSATRNASLVAFSATPSVASVRAGVLTSGQPVALGAAFEVPAMYAPNLFVSPSGEGFLAAKPSGGAKDAPLVLVRGLPDAPRIVTTSVAGQQLIFATTDRAGTPAGLFSTFGSDKVRLLEGEGFTKERWSRGSRDGAALDLVYVDEPGGAVPAVLLGGGNSGQVTAHVIRSAEAETPYAVLGSSFSSCPRSTYVGVTCDACPVTKQCETGQDDVRAARLFTRAGRLFAVYYSTDVRRRMAYVLEKTPIIGVGCVCSLVERGKSEFADSLVVVEILAPADPKNPPAVVEYMRLPLYKARTTGSVSLSPRGDGDVDVLFGPAGASFESALTKFPDKPTPVRVLRLSTKSL